MKNLQGSFEKMNFLSANKIPFFFMIDFLVQNIIIIEEKDLDERKYEIMKKLETQAREKSLENRSERYNSLL